MLIFHIENCTEENKLGQSNLGPPDMFSCQHKLHWWTHWAFTQFNLHDRPKSHQLSHHPLECLFELHWSLLIVPTNSTKILLVQTKHTIACNYKTSHAALPGMGPTVLQILPNVLVGSSPKSYSLFSQF